MTKDLTPETPSPPFDVAGPTLGAAWFRDPAEPLSPDEIQQLRDEAVRAFSTHLAHRLGNLLQVVNGNLELIAQRTTDETTLRYLGNACTAAEELIELARALPIEAPD